MDDAQIVWLFHGNGSRFAGGVFTSRENAERWIGLHELSGVLTGYPLDEGAYDWAVREGHFKVKRDEHQSPNFIQRFGASGSAKHYHYEEGICVA